MSEKSLKSKTISIIAYVLTLAALAFLLYNHLRSLFDSINGMGFGKDNTMIAVGNALREFIFVALVFVSFGLITYGFYKERINDPSKYALLVPCIFLGYFMITCAISLIGSFTSLEFESISLILNLFLFIFSVGGFAGVIILFLKSDYLDIKLYLEDNGVEIEDDEEEDDEEYIDEEDDEYDPMYDPMVNPNVYDLFPQLEEDEEEPKEEQKPEVNEE